jgi:hypothetical protein
VFYGVIGFIANYRISKYFSVYIHQDRLIINNSWWGFLAVKIADITSIKTNEGATIHYDKETLSSGGKESNVELSFDEHKMPLYFSGMGMMKESINKIRLKVDSPEQLKTVLQSQMLKI